MGLTLTSPSSLPFPLSASTHSSNGTVSIPDPLLGYARDSPRGIRSLQHGSPCPLYESMASSTMIPALAHAHGDPVHSVQPAQGRGQPAQLQYLELGYQARQRLLPGPDALRHCWACHLNLHDTPRPGCRTCAAAASSTQYLLVPVCILAIGTGAIYRSRPVDNGTDARDEEDGRTEAGVRGEVKPDDTQWQPGP